MQVSFERALQSRAARRGREAKRVAASARRLLARYGIWWEVAWLDKEFRK